MSKDKLNIDELVQEVIDELIGKTDPHEIEGKSILSKFSKALNAFLEKVGDKLGDYQNAIKEMGGTENFLKFLWNLEEENVDILTFEAVVSWAKKNIDSKKHCGACLLESKNKNEYHLFFLDKDNQPLLSGKDKHKIFYTTMIDEDLKLQFKNSSMLILK